MIDVDVYTKVNDFVKSGTRNAIKTYGGLIRLNNGASILDVGCGDGSATLNILKPLIENHIQHFFITGCDLSNTMLEKAKDTCKSTDINFRQLDIATSDLDEYFVDAYHNIFSFFCLHMVPNYRNWIKNIHTILKPGGQVFFVIAAQNPLSAEIVKQSKEGKWAKYMKTAQEIAGTPFTQLPAPQPWIEKLMIENGFTNVKCKKIKELYVFPNTESLKTFIMAFSVIYQDIPKDSVGRFLHEFTELVGRRCKRFPGNSEYYFDYSLLVLVANK